MEVILLSRIERLGDVGDRIRVRPGYARNYLIPYKKAEMATEENIAALELRKAELEQLAASEKTAAEARAAKLDDAEVTMVVEVGEEGKLFGSVSTGDIAQAASEACGVEVARKEVHLPDGAFREVGEYEITLGLHSDVHATLRLKIVGRE